MASRVGYSGNVHDEVNVGRIFRFGVVGVAVLLFLIVAFNAFYTVDEGERGVLLTNGAITDVAEPGLRWKWPIIQRVAFVSTQTHSKIYDGVESYSRDQQLAELSISVTYRIAPESVAEVYSNFRNEEGVMNRLVDRRALETVKTIFGRFNAAEAIQERSRLNLQIEEALRQELAAYPFLILESVQVEDIAFSQAYENSVEARMMAEVEVQRRAQELEQQRIQAQIVVTQAQAEADSRLAKARAEAEATRLAGEAEADAIRARGAALRENPELVALVTAENWDGRLPQTMLPGGTIPFLNLQ